jgi:hypothetical protein
MARKKNGRAEINPAARASLTHAQMAKVAAAMESRPDYFNPFLKTAAGRASKKGRGGAAGGLERGGIKRLRDYFKGL